MGRKAKIVAGAAALVLLGALVWQGAILAVKAETARLDTKGAAIASALVEFHELYGRFPFDDEGLIVLELPEVTVHDPSGAAIRCTVTDRGAELTAPGYPEWVFAVDEPPEAQ